MSFSWTPHRFAGGALALDVANSVILRFDPARSLDRFAIPEQLDSFAVAATRLSADGDNRGHLLAPAPSNRAILLKLREATDCYFRALVEGRDDAMLLADLLDATAAAIRAAPDSHSLESATARSALALLSGPERQRLRICGNCGWLFIDRSKNRSRIWCDMAVCGNRQKANRHYRKKTEGER